MIKIFLIGGGASDRQRILPADLIEDRHFTFHAGRTSGEDDDAVCQCDGLGEIVGDQKCGFSGFPDNVCDVCGDSESGLEIQGAEGFVQKKEIGVDCHSADQGCALAHTAGEFGGLFILEAIEPVIRKQFRNVVGILFGEGMVELQTENHILIDRAPFKEMIPLQHIADLQSGVSTVLLG